MNIYVGHSSASNYKQELYQPLRESKINTEHTIVLPHEYSEEPFDSKTYLTSSCDIFIAEITHSTLGLGIEMGWSNLLGVPIICIHKTGTKPSRSAGVLTSHFIKYVDAQDLIVKLSHALTSYKLKSNK